MTSGIYNGPTLITKTRSGKPRKRPGSALPWTLKEKRYVKTHLHWPDWKIALKLPGRTASGVEAYRIRNSMQKPPEQCFFQKGHVPENKGKKMSKETYKKVKHTFFKKGQMPATKRPVGFEVIRNDKRGTPRIWISYDPEKRMIEKQIYLWTQLHGPIPKGMILYCKDTNCLNTDPSNWELITRQESIRRCRLTDEHISKFMAGNHWNHDPELREELLKNHKDLIEIKRSLMLAKEKINERNGQTQKYGR